MPVLFISLTARAPYFSTYASAVGPPDEEFITGLDDRQELSVKTTTDNKNINLVLLIQNNLDKNIEKVLRKRQEKLTSG